MPEQLTKHPEVTLQVLKSAGGAKCGEGAPQTILKDCPRERFCALPGGELCVYGLPEAARMTQITPAELLAAAGARSAQPPPAASGAADWPWLAGGIVIGAVLALLASRFRRR